MKKLLILSVAALATIGVPQAAFGDSGDAGALADTEPPVVEIKAWPSATFGRTLPTGVNAIDNDRVSKVEYAIDDRVVLTATNAPGFDVSIDLSGLKAEVHNLKAKAYDPAGNVTITRPRNFLIDRTPPEVTIEGPAITNAVTPQFTFSSPSVDYQSAGCIIQDRGPDGELSACSSDVPFTSTQNLGEGEWQFVVHADDAVRNTTVARHLFVIDRTPPELAFTAGPEDGSTVSGGEVSYSWSATDEHGALQRCSIDNGPPLECDSEIDLSLAEGDHTLEVTATDQADNTGKVVRRLRVKGSGPSDPDPDPNVKDTTAPVVKLTSPKQRLKALQKGLKVKVTCSEACAGSIVAKAAKASGAARGIKFTGRVNLSAAGTTAIRLKPSAKAKKKLKRIKKPLKLTVVSKLADPSGNAAGSTLKTKIRK